MKNFSCANTTPPLLLLYIDAIEHTLFYSHTPEWEKEGTHMWLDANLSNSTMALLPSLT